MSGVTQPGIQRNVETGYSHAFDLSPTHSGILNGLTVAVKGNISVKGYRPSNGNKQWTEAQAKATANAEVVNQFLKSGAMIVGITLLDECTASLKGDSHWLGVPKNIKAPNCAPGGSSSGSAVAVASKTAKCAIGTCCAGSGRIPAANCGDIGLRPSLGRISEEGVVPFSKSSSTVSIMALKLSIIQDVCSVVLRNYKPVETKVRTIYIPVDAINLCDKEIQTIFETAITKLKAKGYHVEPVTLQKMLAKEYIPGLNDTLTSWQSQILGIIQGVEIWDTMPESIKLDLSSLSAPIRGTVEYFFKNAPRDKLEEAHAARNVISERVNAFLQPGDLFFFPTAARKAPTFKEFENPSFEQDYYTRTMGITAFAGTAELPEITLPLADIDGVPVGFSLASGKNNDEFLVAAAKELFPEL